MAKAMLNGYISDDRHIQFKSKPETLRLLTYMKEMGILGISEGLMKVLMFINELTPKFPRTSAPTPTRHNTAIGLLLSPKIGIEYPFRTLLCRDTLLKCS